MTLTRRIEEILKSLSVDEDPLSLITEIMDEVRERDREVLKPSTAMIGISATIEKIRERMEESY